MVLVGRISLGDWGWSPSISRSQLFDGYEPIDTDSAKEEKHRRGRPRKSVQPRIVTETCPFVPKRVLIGEVIS